jgi:CdiI N-terminal domain
MFYIGFVSGARVSEEGWPHAEGELTLGDYSERFEASLTHWRMADYEAHWRRAVARLASGAARSALIVSYGGADGITDMWPMWREGAQVILHERLVLPSEGHAPVDPEHPEAEVGERVSVGEDGPISEWTVPFGAVLAFLAE